MSASLSMTPMSIFRHGADEEKAETARLSSFIGAIAIGDLVKSTLGALDALIAHCIYAQAQTFPYIHVVSTHIHDN
uniref:Uncharacterized protein n=1 Tax=Sinocyclocheilus rhinocerous TaxID=307959 RepID=A0A673K3M0_9TELE